MTKLVAAIVGVAIVGAAGLAIAQPVPPPGRVLDWFDRDNGNSPLACTIHKRIRRDGDIAWMRIECFAERGRGRF